MSKLHERRKAWVAGCVEALNRSGSWTGRIHIHKVLYMLRALGIASPPFQFDLHLYGPYARELDRTIFGMEMYGELETTYRQEGYGPTYKLTDLGRASPPGLSRKARRVLEHTASVLGPLPGSDLELMATCLWVKEHYGPLGGEEIVRLLGQIKPRYSPAVIQQQVDRQETVEARLFAATKKAGSRSRRTSRN
jgi:hypothetical protein